MEKIAENEFIEFYKIDFILYSKCKDGIVLDGDNARKMIELRHQVSNNEKQYWLQDITGLKSVNKEGRDIADKYGQEFIYACASLVNSHITKFMFNTFLKLKGSKIPYQVFADKDRAIKWLLEIKAKNEINTL